MKFLPTPPDQASPSIIPQFFWQADGSVEKQYHLYRESKRVASLWLREEEGKHSLIKLNNEAFELRDKSSFFAPCLHLFDKESGKRLGGIERNALNPGEGMIHLKRQVYGWKFRKRTDTCLILMDEQRRRLFSYHYAPGYVRLLLNKPGQQDEHVVSLLCICLFLLPVMQSTYAPAFQK